MVAENKPDTPQICGTPDLYGTHEGRIAAALHPAPSVQVNRVPGVPQRSQTRGMPRLLLSFGDSSVPAPEPEPSSPPEEEEQSEHADDDGPWIINAEAVAELDSLEEVDFHDIPVCSCGRYCDVQTLDNAWHCSHCDPNAEERRKRTQRLLASAKRIRELN